VCIAVLAAAAPAAAANGVPWVVLATGTTTPSGTQSAVGYIAVEHSQAAAWAGRLEAADRAALNRLNLDRSGAVGVFLDGMTCGSHLTVNRVTRTVATLSVTLHYTRPPIGMEACVRTSTPYDVLAVRRASLGHPAPTHVRIVAVARA
jgi:hypothetical protein